MNEIELRLARLRELMKREHLSAFIFPSTDAHPVSYTHLNQLTSLAALDSTRLQQALALEFGVQQDKVTGAHTYGRTCGTYYIIRWQWWSYHWYLLRLPV